jgi:dihydroxy-acid dehydratase
VPAAAGNRGYRPDFQQSFSQDVGHITPEAQIGGTLALVKDGDMITINAEDNTIVLDVDDKELELRKAQWKAPELKVSRGVLYKYAKAVSSASAGCVTDENI